MLPYVYSLVIEYYVYYVLKSCQRLKEPGSTSTCANFWFPFNNMFNFKTLTFFFLFVVLNIIMCVMYYDTHLG